MEDIVVASTTDTQEDVNEAAGLPADEEQPESGAEPENHGSAEETDDKEEKPDGKAAKTEDEGGEDEKPSKNHKKLLKRIDTLTRLRKESEEREQHLRQQLDEAQKKSGAAPKPPEKPKRADFQSDEDYEKALFEWKDKEDARKASDSRLATTFAAYNKGIEAVRTEHEDWDEVMSQDIPIPMAVQNTIVGMGQRGPEVAYWLASNPDLCEELVEVERSEGSAAAVLELGKRLAARDGGASAAGGGNRVPGKSGARATAELDEDEEETPARKKPQSKAPAPVKPVTGASTRSTTPMDELPYSEYRKVREQQERAGRKR